MIYQGCSRQLKLISIPAGIMYSLTYKILIGNTYSLLVILSYMVSYNQKE